jgi:hypothetical protein
MKMHVRFGVIAMLLAICAGGLGAAPADSSKSLAVPGNKKSSPPTQIFNRKLSSTTMIVGNDYQDIGSGEASIDSPLTFTCPTGGCTVAAEIHVQLGLNTISGNTVGLCTELDGFDMPPQGCPVAGTIPNDNSFAAYSFEFAQGGVKAGQHYMQSFVYTSDGARRSRYLITYRLYTP